MISAIEKRKLVYVLNRDASGRPTIASPLEAHRTRAITFATVGIDNGYDNPIFAALELQYSELEDGERKGGEGDAEKQLAYYELDLGLNHVSRRWAASAHRTACSLAAVPGGGDGPGGVLVGGEDWIEYMHETLPSAPSDPMQVDGPKTATKVLCAVPRRDHHPKDKGLLVTTITVHRQKKSKFFALAQTELGDVYKVTLNLDPSDKTKVMGMTVALLDTTSVGNALNVSKLGMLFVPAEFGDHPLYQFERIDLPDAPTCTSLEARNAYLASSARSEAEFYAKTTNASSVAKTFTPTMLKNLRKIYAMDSLAPTTGVLVGELAGEEVSPQIYALTGRGPTSALRVLRHGVAVTELAVSDLPGTPGGIFTVADNSPEHQGKHRKRRTDRYIVVSFADATLVLSVGETVEEMGKESGFLTNAPTLACSALGHDGGICQVHPGGVRHIHRGRAKQWHCPGLKRIECASANESQVIIALAGGEVIYFELDPVSGNLTESATRDMGADVCCLDVGVAGKGRARSMFAAVGCRDLTVRIVGLHPGEKLLSPKSSAALGSRPHSVALQLIPSSSGGGGDEIVLAAGLDDGSAVRSSVDPVTGAIGTSPARRFLGARPVSVSRIDLDGRPGSLMLSSRPWIGRSAEGGGSAGKHVTAPLSYAPLDHGCSFRSDAIREGIVATAGTTLRILSVESMMGGTGGGASGGGDDESFNSNRVPLRYTPRGMTLLAAGAEQRVPGAAAGQGRNLVLAVVEADYNDYGLEEKNALGFDPTGGADKDKKKVKKEDDDAMDMDEGSDEEEEAKKKDEDDEEFDEEDDEEERESRRTPIRGPIAGPGRWGSCVRLLDPSDSCATLDVVEMQKNEAALCCASVRFHSRGGEALLAVGTVTNMTLHPLKQTASHVALYRVLNGERLQLLHRTEVDNGSGGGGAVLALVHFQGRLLVGVGRTLRLYEMGKRQLLRKCELRGLPTAVKTLQAAGDRAYVGDLLQSMQFVRYDSTANRLILVANDRTPRPITCQELLDLNTVAVGDKFGNVSVLRLPRGADGGAVDTTGARALWDASRESATPKLDALAQYHVGEVVTGMTRASLVAGGSESLIYVTVTGRVGALVPFVSRDDVEFYSQLEGLLRTDVARPTGREPQAYRSYYAPVKHVIDGDLTDAYNALGYEEQKRIAEKLDRTVGEVVKKLEDTRNGLL